MRSSRLLAVLSVVGLWASATAAASLNPEDAVGHIGETATVCGVVASAKYEAEAKSQPTLLDLSGWRIRMPSSPPWCMGRTARNSGTPETGYRGKRICVTGQISDYQGKPEIVLTSHAAALIDVDGEAAQFRAALMREVPEVIVDHSEGERVWIARAKAAVDASAQTIDRAQLLIVVDRNPDIQQLRIVLARPDREWESLGGTRVSTGQTGRRDHYLTPTGVFLHTDLILDWRAEGTFNAQHIRGLGLKGMRVWDFGWQRTAKGWGTGEEGDIRLLLHATDPDALERRLGRPASKGCVRIPTAMNQFLDRHGIFDADYEQAAKDDAAFDALLLPDRRPTPLAGNALVVVDSSDAPAAALAAPHEAVYAVGATTGSSK